MSKHNELKVLLLDLELTYGIYYAFPSKKPQYLSAKQIKAHQRCVCAAWKWLDQVSVQSATSYNKCDKAIAKALHKVMEEADIIVAHNGDRFDLLHANNLFEKHGLGPVTKKKTLDTLKIARKYFAFAGNDLDSLSKRFGGKGKSQKPDWILLTENDKKEIALATKYCKDDVRELERVFIALRPYVDRLPHAPYGNKCPSVCDACGSKRLIKKGTEWDGYRNYRRVKCQECGYNHRLGVRS